MSLGAVKGKVAWVDLQTGVVEYDSPPEDVYLEYLGGYGLGAHYLYKRQPAGVDPLGPENILGFATGPLTGTPAITGSRLTVFAKSPKTGGWGDANCGGHFGAPMKQAGLDALFVRGVSDKPVYLVLESGEVTIRDAGRVWGQETGATDDLMRTEHGRRARVMTIGPVGERANLLACIVNDKGRVAGRSGLGAVMGSKRLKAVVAVGGGDTPLADADGFKSFRKELIAAYCNAKNPAWAEMHTYGTPASLVSLVGMGDTPVKNWAGVAGDFPTAERVGGEAVHALLKRHYGCWQCPIACGGHVTVPDGPYAGEGHMPEYETIGAFGPMCLNDNLESICRLNNICNESGMDTISAGGTLAFAIECFDNGLITEKDLGGLRLTWGDHAAMVALAGQIARGEGFGGAVLADGALEAARRIGPAAEELAMQCGGEELGMHDPRCFPGIATSYFSDATPGRHTQGGAWFAESSFMPEDLDASINDRYKYEGKGDAAKMLADFTHMLNSAGLCQFSMLMIPAAVIPRYFELGMGRTLEMPELLEIGERLANLRMAFNLREGVRNRTDYRMPDRCLGIPPQTDGETKGITVDHEVQLRDYYEARGWNADTGVPLPATFERLGLDYAVEALG